MLDLTQTNGSAEIKKQIDMQFPADAVEGSRKARFDVIGIRICYMSNFLFCNHSD